MVGKAKTIIDVMNLFRPEALTEETINFYQNTAAVREGAKYEFHNALYESITNSTANARLLVVGHRGSGKSTELHLLASQLDESDYISIIVEATDDLDLYNFSYIDLFIVIANRVAEYAKDHKLSIKASVIDAFEASLSETVKNEHWDKDASVGAGGEVSITARLLSFLKGTASVASTLKMSSGMNEELRRKIQPSMPIVAQALNALIDNLNNETKKSIVIIIDGLDRTRLESVHKLFVEDVSAITEIKAHLVIGCPLAIYRSVEAAGSLGLFSVTAVLPAIKIHHQNSQPDESGIKVITELVYKRADKSFFKQGVLREIIKKAGGSLRDTCQLLSESAFEAHMRGLDQIDKSSVSYVMNKYAVEVFLRVPEKCYEEVKMIYNGDHSIRQNEAITDLLYGGTVFEYNGERWRDLHPLLRDYIDNHQEVLGG